MSEVQNNKKKKIKSNAEFGIDPDKAIEIYNRNNPTLKQLDRQGLSEILECTPQHLSDMKQRPAPVVIQRLKVMAKITGEPIDTFIVEREKYQNHEGSGN